MNQIVLIIAFAASTANFNFYGDLFTRFLKTYIYNSGFVESWLHFKMFPDVFLILLRLWD